MNKEKKEWTNERMDELSEERIKEGMRERMPVLVKAFYITDSIEFPFNSI